MSRPRTDPLEVLARAAAALRDAPDSSANEICRQIGGRRCDVLAAVKALRAVMPEERPASRRSRFPMTQAILTLLAFGALVTAYGYITVVRPHRRFDQSESIRWTHDCLTKQGFKRNDRLQNITGGDAYTGHDVSATLVLSDPPPTAADEKGARGYVRGWAILRAKRTRILEKDLDKKKLEAGVRRSVQRRGRALVLFLGNERDFIYASPKAKLPFLRCVTVVNRPNAVVRHFALFDVSSVDRPFVQRPEGNK